MKLTLVVIRVFLLYNYCGDIMLIDTHCHLSKEYYNDISSIVDEMDGIMIVSGCNKETNEEVLKLTSKYKNVYGTLGIHPEDIETFSEDNLNFIEKNITNKKIVAVGEIGLDYHYNSDNKEEQKKLLIKQLDLASKYNKPVVIHSRDAIQDIYDILKNYKLKGTIHCFNSSYEMAKEFIKLGYKIGVGGVITFSNAKKLIDVIEKIDLSDILIETDSPYLTPEPYRGKQNKPSYVYYVAKKISEIKGISIDEVIKTTSENAINQFDLNA